MTLQFWNSTEEIQEMFAWSFRYVRVILQHQISSPASNFRSSQVTLLFYKVMSGSRKNYFFLRFKKIVKQRIDTGLKFKHITWKLTSSVCSILPAALSNTRRCHVCTVFVCFHQKLNIRDKRLVSFVDKKSKSWRFKTSFMTCNQSSCSLVITY